MGWLFKFSNSADCLHFQSLLLALVCQDFYSLLHYLGYEKILGLRRDKEGQKRSLEARADAFSRLKNDYQMKVGMFIGKVKKYGIGWCIPHRMAADNAEGGFGQTPPRP